MSCAVIKNTDMFECMQQEAIEVASCAVAMYKIEKDIAAYVKKEFDKKYNPNWHCAVGKEFGSYLSHETSYYIHFFIGDLGFVLFKCG